MLDYCGVYIGVSTRFSPLFNFDFSLAINRLGKQNAGKKFLPNFFFLKEGPIAALLKPPRGLKRPIAALLNCHYSLFCFKKNPIVVVLKVPVYVIRTYCHTCCATLQSAGKKGACIGHFGLYQHFLGLSQRFKNSRIVPVFCSGCR